MARYLGIRGINEITAYFRSVDEWERGVEVVVGAGNKINVLLECF